MSDTITKPIDALAQAALSEQIQMMTSLGAWKQVEAILDRIVEDADNTLDMIPTSELGAAAVFIAEARGKKAAVKKLRADLSYLRDGQFA